MKNSKIVKALIELANECNSCDGACRKVTTGQKCFMYCDTMSDCVLRAHSDDFEGPHMWPEGLLENLRVDLKAKGM